MEKYVEIEFPSSIDLEWMLTVNARKFADYIKTVEDNEVKLHIDPDKKTLAIKSDSDNFKLNGIAGSEYLWLPSLVPKHQFGVDAKQFSAGLSKVDFAVKEKNFSPVLTGILMRHKIINGQSYLIFVGTDSLRLAEYRVAATIDAPEFSVIIPKTNIAELKHSIDYVAGLWAEQVQVTIADNLIWIEWSVEWIRISTVSLLIQWTFPDYDNENIMPTQFITTAVVDKGQAEKAIKKINILTRDTNNFINLVITESSVMIESWETDTWEANSLLQAVVNWPAMTIGVNGRYVSDIIRFTHSNKLILNVVAEEKPVMFTDEDDSNYRYVIRPILK